MCVALGAFGSIFSALSTAMSVVTGVMDFFGGNEDADNQVTAIQQSYANQNAAYNERLKEISDETKSRKEDLAKEAAIRRGQIRVASGEAGVSGLMVDALLNDVTAQTGRAYARLDDQRRKAMQQTYRNQQGIAADAQSRVNAVNSERPSALGTAVQVAGNLASSFSKKDSGGELNETVNVSSQTRAPGYAKYAKTYSR